MSLRRSIVLLILFWVGFPILAALPSIGLYAPGDLVHAYADAVSQITTTGAQFIPRQNMAKSYELWHAGLQWMGGYASIVLTLLVLAPLNMSAPGVHRSPFLTIDKGNVAARGALICTSMLILYMGASLVVFFALILSKVELYSALLLTMGSISTGGFTPTGVAYSEAIGSVGSWIGVLAMSYGALGFALHWDVFKRRANYVRDTETIGFFGFAILAGILFVLLGHPVAASFQNAFSLLSTTAVPMHADGFSGIPIPVLLALVLTGGAAISTAGGVKIIRFIILFRQTRVDLAQLSHPSSTPSIHFAQMKLEPFELVGLWAYVLGYAVVISGLVIFLGNGGIEFGEATNIAIAAISNAGPVYTPDGGNAGDFSALSGAMAFGLSLVMALGRIEILAAFAILSPEFWRD